MPSTAEPVHSASSPPFVLDSDMTRHPSTENPEFFDSHYESPSFFLAEDEATEDSQFLGAFGLSAVTKSPFAERETPALDTQTVSAPSTVSPSSSYQDDSSESSGYNRKSSSDSSRSVRTSADVMMADEMDMGDWKADDMLGTDTLAFGGYDGTINPSKMDTNFDFSDKNMDNDFDFESASSSPNMFGAGLTSMNSPEIQVIKQDTPVRRKSSVMKTKSKTHNKANSQYSVTQSMNGLSTGGSREASPLSAVILSQESSPSAYFNNSPSPGTIDFMGGTMHQNAQPLTHAPWAQSLGYPQTGGHITHHGLPNQSIRRVSSSQVVPNQGISYKPNKPTLIVHPTPLKSRVETQIPIKLTLTMLPTGITKLHLPTHTISKPKLLAKPVPERSPDTLELYTSLVCTSAMQNPKNQQRAFERAAKGESSVVQTPSDDDEDDEDDENKPLNGGDVRICQGCITRERKRAARKKVKKVEEEESWHKDEARRVIVFNTQEIKDWASPTSQPPSEATLDPREPFIPPGSMQVDAPMRIACYCRHQNEKLGFQVIFTIKDYQDRLIAQAMTSSIMITDDHKTHNIPPSLSAQNSSGSDLPSFPVASLESSFDMSSTAIAPATNIAPFHASSSSSDIPNLQNASFDQQSNGYALSQQSQTTSMSMTPRNLSRQASPSASIGPTSKKRKASGSSKVPTGLAMTKLETGVGFGQGASSTPMSAAPSSVTSPYTPNLSAFPQSIENPFQPFSAASTIPQTYASGPLTPNSNDQFFTNGHRSQSVENLAMHQLYSAPASAHPSRAPSPNGLRNSAQNYAQQQQQMAQAFTITNGLYGAVPIGLNLGRPPTINKLIPGEGPKNGGIEVTCLGSGFCQGLEVMFGDVKATTTTFWGETSLVCLLPPSAVAGLVPVTFHHQHQQQHMPGFSAAHIPKNQPFFKYVDDDEQQIIRTALSVLGHKMTGKMEDVTQLARRIVGDGNSSWGSSIGQSQNGTTGGSGFNVATLGLGDSVEKTLLRILDLIDLDDSTFVPRLNLRRASGQTMLHLACSLGFLHFAAALLARGANPEPRDKGGFTPMHFAALHNHPTIVRRLMLSGADPTVRSLRGYTPSDMATSAEVLRATRRIEQHSRTCSGISMRSRTSSATSLRSLWEPTPPAPIIEQEASNESSDDDDNEYQDEDADSANDGAFWMRSSRRPSAQKSRKQSLASEKDPVVELPPDIGNTGGLASPTAAVAAFREQLSAHIQNFQQTMQLNFPNFPHMNLPQMNLPQMNLPQMPNFGMIPAFPDYQAYFPTTPMVRRISNLVGNKPSENTTQQDYRWWAPFAGNAVTAPPAYEDIFPEDEVKRASATQAAADAVADNKCAELFDQAESSTAVQKKPVILSTVRIGQKHTITKEQQDQLRLAHAEKLKRLSRDRNLFFIWIPLLIVILLAMLYNRVPQVWSGVSEFFAYRSTRNEQARSVEAL